MTPPESDTAPRAALHSPPAGGALPDGHEGGGVVLVYVTAPNEEIGAGLARTLVSEKLAACGNLIPGLRSIYAWQGTICDEPEVLLLLKSRRARMAALTARVVELHPYDCPEVVAVPVAAGHAPYLAWVVENTALT